MDITKFCAEVEPFNIRFPIKTPWVKAGWRYATDVRIVVREKTDEPDDRPGYPEVEALFAGRTVPMHDSAWTVVPTHDGSFKEWKEPACEQVEEPTAATCKHMGTCPATSDLDCPNKVVGRTPRSQRFAGKRWGGRYIVLLNEELPGATYALDANGWMHFRLGDVEGMLAWMKH